MLHCVHVCIVSLYSSCGEVSSWASPPGGIGRRVPPVRNSGRCPPRNRDFYFFINICQNFQFIQYFQNKVGEIQQKSDFWVGGFDSPESVPPVKIRPPSRHFVATPLGVIRLIVVSRQTASSSISLRHLQKRCVSIVLCQHRYCRAA